MTSPLFPGDPFPYPKLAALREEAPFVQWAGTWFVLSYSLAQDLLRHGHLSRQAYLDQVYEEMGDSEILRAQRQELAFQDPPFHTQLKKLVMLAFSPARLKTFQAHITEVFAEAAAGLPEGPFDLLALFADPIPAGLLSELMGVPPEDRDLLYAATGQLVAGRGAERTPEAMAAGSAGVATLKRHFEELIAQRRSSPGDDLLTALIHAEEDGDRLTHDQLLSVSTSMYAASYGNVRNVIGNGMLALLDHPQPVTDMAACVEEILRFDGSTQATNAAVLMEPFGGMPAGARVAIHIGACNHDEAHFAEPDRFIADRKPNDHLALSAGTHFCAGAHLVRLQARAAFSALLPLGLELVERPEYVPADRFRGLKTLMLRRP